MTTAIERTEKVIRAEIDAARAEYQAAVATKPAHECAPLSTLVTTLQAELHALLAKGAVRCPLTGDTPIGMKKRAGVYEVGPRSSPLRARGETAADAVEAWNNGQYVPPADPARNGYTPPDLNYEPVGLDAFPRPETVEASG